MYPLKVNPTSVLFRLTMEGRDGLHALLQQWRCLLSFLPREPSVLVLCSRPHGPLLPAHLRLPKQPHRQRGRAAHEGARALGGRAPVCQPPARRQQQPHSSSCQTRPRGQPGQAALSSQGAHGRGEERMRPERCWPRGSGRWLCHGVNCSGAVPSGTSRGHQGPHTAEWPLWLPFMHPCFSCVAVGSFPWFISTICVWKRWWSCFYSPPAPYIPGTLKGSGSWLAPACLDFSSCVKQMVGSSTSLPDVSSGTRDAPRHQLLHCSQQRGRNVQVYPSLACCFLKAFDLSQAMQV